MKPFISALLPVVLALSSTAALAQEAAPAPATAYGQLSLLSWEAQTQSQSVSASFDGVDTVTGRLVETAGRASAQGQRLLVGKQVLPWLGIELQMATGGSRRFTISQTTADFEVIFPPGFDFSQIDSIDDVNLDDFELDTTTTEDGLSAKADLNQLWSLMLRPAWVPNDLFSVYALVGYSYAKVDYQTEPSWYTVSERGLSYGVGAEVSIFPEATGGKLRAHVDYVRYLDASELELDALSFGLGIRF